MAYRPTPPGKVKPFPSSVGVYQFKTTEESKTYRPWDERFKDLVNRLRGRKRPGDSTDA